MVYQTVLVLVVQVLEQEELALVVLELDLVLGELEVVQEELGLGQELGVQELKQVCFYICIVYTDISD